MGNAEPDLNLLVALRALLEEANVTRAGGRIGVGQSTMSAALSRLRALFQDELLVRVGRDYELTPLAVQLLPEVQITLPLIAQALGQEKPFDPATTQRTFRFQVSDHGAIALRPLFDRARAIAPGIRFDLNKHPIEPTDEGRLLLANDFLLTTPGSGVDAEGIELSRDEYVVVADSHNPVVSSGRISLEDFVQAPYIHCDFGRTHISPVERRMHELDIHPPVRVTTSSMLSIPLIVADTDLIGVVPRRLVERNADVVDVVAVPTPFPPVDFIHRLSWHPSHTHDAGHAWLRSLVSEPGDGMPR